MMELYHDCRLIGGYSLTVTFLAAKVTDKKECLCPSFLIEKRSNLVMKDNHVCDVTEADVPFSRLVES